MRKLKLKKRKKFVQGCRERRQPIEIPAQVYLPMNPVLPFIILHVWGKVKYD